MSSNQTPEQIARDTIDAQLKVSGWAVQHKDGINFHEAEGQAVREYTTDTGPADYVLFIDGKPVGVIEAKKETLGANITAVEDQTADYAAAKLKWVQNTGIPLPFLYEATGVITRFTDQRDPKPRSREVFSFHRPETLRESLVANRSLRARLHDLPGLDPTNLRECQIEAVTNLEGSLKQAKPRALIQMATGAGKTFTAITSVYRLLKHARVRRVLFLVDTRNLGEQAEQEFLAFTPNDDNRKFTELYSAQRLASAHVPADAQVCISTIQRMYSILQGTDLDESAEDENPAEHSTDRKREPLPVAYNEKVPPEFFDLIVIDECHRSIYNLWKQVLDYFDAFLVGLTATPDGRTYGFFKQNVVSEYTHEDAVADGVNVQGEIYTIETAVSKQGGTVLKGLVEKREKLTRAKRWQQQDEDQAYSAKKLDRDIVNPSQIRTVIRAFRDKLPEIFPDRTDATGAYEVPKTLIFAKTDSHADDIINIVREEFGEGNAFCKKVTFGTSKGVKRITFDPADDKKRQIEDDYIQEPETAKSALAQFRNGYHPRIAVTVDMIATGTDVKPLECLLFMRDVKSKGYFEQMKGRGTRTLDLDGLRKVSSAAKSGKTHYVIVDAIGVTKSLKTASRPPITRPTVPFKDLAMEVVMGASDADTVSSLAGRLARIERQLTPLQKHQIAEKMGGTALGQLVKNLFHAIDGEAIEQRALALAGQPPGTDPGDAAREKAQQQLVAAARAPLTGAVVTLIVETCTANMQTIDHDTQDQLLNAAWDGDIQERAAAFAHDFETFCRDHRDQLDALTIYYSQPRRRQEVTLAQIKDVLSALRQHAPRLAPLRVWDAYARLDEVPANARPLTELTALIALLRRACGIDQKLTPFADTVRRNYRDWIVRENAGNPFTAAQTAWLQLIRDHVMTSFRLDREDLEYSPFDAQGGLGKMYQLFGDRMDPLVAELNKELTA
jgi:type I restriction enzyme, R subunit